MRRTASAQDVGSVTGIETRSATVAEYPARGSREPSEGKVMKLADVDGAFTKAIGLVIDLLAIRLSGRSERCSMTIQDGVVTKLDVEKNGAGPRRQQRGLHVAQLSN